MLGHTSVYSCYLSQRICMLRQVFRSIVTTTDNVSSYRSTSRFSLKIARFLFSQHRIKHAALTVDTTPNTHTQQSPSEVLKEITELTRNFAISLEPG
jgi:hypothetical protein